MQARSTGEPELLQAQRRRREARDAERGSAPRRTRRRRQSTSWLQRNALGVAAVSVLVAFLGLGFGLLQMLSRPDASSAALGQNDLAMQSSTGSIMSAAAVNGSVQTLAAPIVGTVAAPEARPIQATAKVLQPDYTIAAGDTLVKIAQRFNTSVDRVQAFNANLSDPRALRIGAQLIIPPPL